MVTPAALAVMGDSASSFVVGSIVVMVAGGFFLSVSTAPLRRGAADRIADTIVVPFEAPDLITSRSVDVESEATRPRPRTPWGPVATNAERRRGRTARLDDSPVLVLLLVATLMAWTVDQAPLAIALAVIWIVRLRGRRDLAHRPRRGHRRPPARGPGGRRREHRRGPGAAGRSAARAMVLAVFWLFPPLLPVFWLWMQMAKTGRGPHDLVAGTVVVAPGDGPLMAVPLRDDSPRRQVPWVVLALIALNVAVFLFLQPASLQQGRADTGSLTAEQDRELSEHFSAWGAVPCEIRALESRSDGARCTSDADRPIIEDKPVPGSLLTAMFLHGSLAHLAVNMLFLWVFGGAVEDRFGPGPFLGLYLLGGIAGTLTYVALDPRLGRAAGRRLGRHRRGHGGVPPDRTPAPHPLVRRAPAPGGRWPCRPGPCWARSSSASWSPRPTPRWPGRPTSAAWWPASCWPWC